ncbi:hypothetical protein PDESU_05804 [Pontiella desulfatans]|uniref:Helix-turn-helix domain-containing protein n=1 Tax=Pontiella desulfatans TaxID=2750659 RepID=A0A6C2UAR5_PONDE|nr:helix-turn-helix domain-containing protein [Pontiella desulfatans]VGO17208.1 hypothetical protein PDESU_05804 [Pontiella desulfatans]
MTGNTEVIKLMVKNDQTIPDDTRKEILDVLSRQGRGRRPRLINRRQVAELLGGISTKTVDRYIQQGLIREIRFTSRRIRFDEAEILRLAREGVGHE